MAVSAIFKLHNDILLSIFDTITSQIPARHTDQNARPLTIIKATSQVCQQWRGLLLASPWIWGRLVDLNVKSNIDAPESIEWLEKVVGRTKSAALWIYGDVEYSDTDPTVVCNVESFFIRLLESWERIEKLSVFIDSAHEDTLSRIQNQFLCRAPILNFFDVHFDCLDNPLFLDTLQPGSSKSLFADYAPFLRVMKAYHVAYKPDSPWLSRIRDIDPLPQNLTLQDTFILLQHTPMVERIGLYGLKSPWPAHHQTQPSFPKLVLPNLSAMTLQIDLPALATMLDRITPGTLSSFVIKVFDCETIHLHNSLISSSFKENLPLYISSYLSTNSVTCVQFSMGDRHFRLCDASNVNFDVRIDAELLWDQRDWDIIATSLFDAFTETLMTNPSVLRTVTKLRLPRLDTYFTLIPKVHSMLALFRHVQHIETNEHDLWVLSSPEEDGQSDERILFPELHTLCLTNLNSSCATLVAFIMTRIDIGYPVAKLDLNSCIISPNDGNSLCSLEGAHGLELVWTKWWESRGHLPETCGHICGTGGLRRLMCSM